MTVSGMTVAGPGAEGVFIAGDWGTSRLRLHLVKGGQSIAEKSGAGLGPISASGESPQKIFEDTVSPWVDTHGPLSAILCGMVGANIGWTTVPYVDCPAGADALAVQLTRVEAADVAVGIVPGMACTNSYGAPDVMRGEETQIVGALSLGIGVGSGGEIMCLPGTHSKWVQIENGAIKTFHTALTGELFGVLCEHSILLRGSGAQTGAPEPEAFAFGVQRSAELGGDKLLHLLFEARARQIQEARSPDWARSFLSGLLIGSEVGAILGNAGTKQTITIVGEGEVCALYQAACAHYQAPTHIIDGGDAVLAGLLQIQAALEVRAA